MIPSTACWTKDYKSFIQSDHAATDELLISVHTMHAAAFRELVQRGANLWPDAPPYIKELADIITNNGVVQQDYYAQDTSPKNDAEKKTTESILLGKGVSYE